MHPSYELRLGFLKAVESTIGIERMQEKHFDMLDNIGQYAESLFKLEPAGRSIDDIRPKTPGSFDDNAAVREAADRRLQPGDEVQVIQPGDVKPMSTDGLAGETKAAPMPATKTLSTILPEAPDPGVPGTDAPVGETLSTAMPLGMPDYEQADKLDRQRRAAMTA